MDVHRPELLGEDVLCGRVLAVGLPEAGLVGVRRVAGDGGGRDGAVVGRVAGVGEAVVAADGAALGPPEAGLAPASLLPG